MSHTYFYCRCGKKFVSYSFLRDHIVRNHPGTSVTSLNKMILNEHSKKELIELGRKDVQS